jgi:hypothetical protein
MVTAPVAQMLSCSLYKIYEQLVHGKKKKEAERKIIEMHGIFLNFNSTNQIVFKNNWRNLSALDFKSGGRYQRIFPASLEKILLHN